MNNEKLQASEIIENYCCGVGLPFGLNKYQLSYKVKAMEERITALESVVGHAIAGLEHNVKFNPGVIKNCDVECLDKAKKLLGYKNG